MEVNTKPLLPAAFEIQLTLTVRTIHPSCGSSQYNRPKGLHFKCKNLMKHTDVCVVLRVHLQEVRILLSTGITKYLVNCKYILNTYLIL